MSERVNQLTNWTIAGHRAIGLGKHDTTGQTLDFHHCDCYDCVCVCPGDFTDTRAEGVKVLLVDRPVSVTLQPDVLIGALTNGQTQTCWCCVRCGSRGHCQPSKPRYILNIRSIVVNWATSVRCQSVYWFTGLPGDTVSSLDQHWTLQRHHCSIRAANACFEIWISYAYVWYVSENGRAYERVYVCMYVCVYVCARVCMCGVRGRVWPPH